MLHKFLSDVLSYDECDEIYNAFIKIENRRSGKYNFTEPLKFVDKVKSRIQEFGDFKFIDVYTRTYLANEFLYMHVDQDLYDLTVTININGYQGWAINCSNLPILKGSDRSRYLNDYTSYESTKGNGVVCFGKQSVHWRDKLIVLDTESVTQTLYHFTFANRYSIIDEQFGY
jgi:hypothetical protein